MPEKKKKKARSVGDGTCAPPMSDKKNKTKDKHAAEDGIAGSTPSMPDKQKTKKKNMEGKRRKPDALTDDSHKTVRPEKAMKRRRSDQTTPESDKTGGGGKTAAELPSWIAKEQYRVMVKKLPLACDEETLEADFGECGEIENLKLLVDKETGESRGMAFITFKDEAGLEAALAFNGDLYGGQKIVVQKAVPKGQAGAKTESTRSHDPGAKPEGCNSVVAKGLSFDLTEKELKKHFATCGGGPIRVGILTDKFTGKSRGTARIDFDHSDERGVDAAMELSGTELKGKVFYLNYCKPKAQW